VWQSYLNIDYCLVFQGLQNLSVNCFLDAAVGALRDRCDGLTSCQVAADTFRLAPADPCPAHARYLEAHYVCNSRTGSRERYKDTHWSVKSIFFCGRMPLFLFIFIFYNIHTFIQSQYIYPSPFAIASLHFLIACTLSGENLPVVPSRESN
jgi:hypothetical protein